jgi:hypothetical protein
LDEGAALKELHRQLAKEKTLHDLFAEIKVRPWATRAASGFP